MSAQHVIKQKQCCLAKGIGVKNITKLIFKNRFISKVSTNNNKEIWKVKNVKMKFNMDQNGCHQKCNRIVNDDPAYFRSNLAIIKNKR